MTEREALKLALEAFKSGDLRDIEAATQAIESILASQRKPLMDEEIKAALVSVDPETKRLPPGFRDFARAIEAAHGIKGEA